MKSYARRGVNKGKSPRTHNLTQFILLYSKAQIEVNWSYLNFTSLSFSAAAGFAGTQGPYVFTPQEQQQYLAQAAASGALLPGNN